MCKFSPLLILIFHVLFLTNVSAQEMQLHLDEDGKLRSIDSQLEKKLNLFGEYKTFQRAQLFLTPDSAYVLEIYYMSEGTVYKIRKSLTEAEVESLRRTVSEKIMNFAPQTVLDQEGRSTLIVGTTALSLVYYQWAIPTALNVHNDKIYLALNMLSIGGGFYAPYWMTRDRAVTEGMATLGLYGGSRGIAHGYFLHNLLGGGEVDNRWATTAGVLGGITEGLYGISHAKKTNMTTGSAETIRLGGDFGLAIGMGAAFLANFTDEGNERKRSGALLLGSGAGLWAGANLANRFTYSRGDIYIVQAVGILGAYVPLSIVDATGTDDGKVYVSAAMAGSVAGLWLGHTLVRGMDFSTGRGTLISLGEITGGLIGLGLARLVSNGDNSTLYLSASAVGAMSGFAVMYSSQKKAMAKTGEREVWRISVAPQNLVVPELLRGRRRSNPVGAPVISVEYRF